MNNPTFTHTMIEKPLIDCTWADMSDEEIELLYELAKEDTNTEISNVLNLEDYR